MARTKASVGAKVSTTKSTKARAAAPPPPSPRSGGGGSGGGGAVRGLAGGNPACPRETPAWQLPITRFFNAGEKPSGMDTDDAAGAPGPSKPASSRRVRNAIHSDDDMDTEPDTNTAPDPAHDTTLDAALDTTLDPDLPPLDGDSCHKIAEYFPRRGRDDGQVAAASTGEGQVAGASCDENKENVEGRRNSAKRELDEGAVSVSKKVKTSLHLV